MEDEGFLAALVDAHADEVGGHEVGGELHPREAQAERDGQRVGEGGLAHAGHVFDQKMTPGKKTGHRVLDLPAFADDDRANLIHQL